MEAVEHSSKILVDLVEVLVVDPRPMSSGLSGRATARRARPNSKQTALGHTGRADGPLAKWTGAGLGGVTPLSRRVSHRGVTSRALGRCCVAPSKPDDRLSLLRICNQVKTVPPFGDATERRMRLDVVQYLSRLAWQSPVSRR